MLAVSKEGLDDGDRPSSRTIARFAHGVPARTSLRDGFAGVGARGAARGRGANKGSLSPYSRQGRAGTAGAAFRRGARKRSRPIARFSRRLQARASASPWLFPADGASGHLTRQAFARDLKACAAAAGIARGAGQPACAPSCLREPLVAKWRRFARRAGIARARRHFNNADLYPCAR